MWLNGNVTCRGAACDLAGEYCQHRPRYRLAGGTVTITPTAGTTNSADILIQWTPQTDKTATRDN